MVSTFKSRISCTFSNWIFQSKNIISCLPVFLVSALQFDGLLIPMCGIQFLLCKLYVKRPCVPYYGNLSSSCI